MGKVRRHRVSALVAVILLAAWPVLGQTVIDGDSLQIGAGGIG
jgi:hypothetical protein